MGALKYDLNHQTKALGIGIDAQGDAQQRKARAARLHVVTPEDCVHAGRPSTPSGGNVGR